MGELVRALAADVAESNLKSQKKQHTVKFRNNVKNMFRVNY